jgi:hypothetical protein
MPTNQAKPGAEPVVNKTGVTEIEAEDVEKLTVIYCDRCSDDAKTGFLTESMALHEFTDIGWRRINNRVHCPECVAEATNKEGGEG